MSKQTRKEINHRYYINHIDYFRDYYKYNRTKLLEYKRLKDLNGLGSKQTKIISEIKDDKSLLYALERELKRLNLK